MLENLNIYSSDATLGQVVRDGLLKLGINCTAHPYKKIFSKRFFKFKKILIINSEKELANIINKHLAEDSVVIIPARKINLANNKNPNFLKDIIVNKFQKTKLLIIGDIVDKLYFDSVVFKEISDMYRSTGLNKFIYYYYPIEVKFLCKVITKVVFSTDIKNNLYYCLGYPVSNLLLIKTITKKSFNQKNLIRKAIPIYRNSLVYKNTASKLNGVKKILSQFYLHDNKSFKKLKKPIFLKIFFCFWGFLISFLVLTTQGKVLTTGISLSLINHKLTTPSFILTSSTMVIPSVFANKCSPVIDNVSATINEYHLLVNKLDSLFAQSLYGRLYDKESFYKSVLTNAESLASQALKTELLLEETKEELPSYCQPLVSAYFSKHLYFSRAAAIGKLLGAFEKQNNLNVALISVDKQMVSPWGGSIQGTSLVQVSLENTQLIDQEGPGLLNENGSVISLIKDVKATFESKNHVDVDVVVIADEGLYKDFKNNKHSTVNILKAFDKKELLVFFTDPTKQKHLEGLSVSGYVNFTDCVGICPKDFILLSKYSDKNDSISTSEILLSLSFEQGLLKKRLNINLQNNTNNYFSETIEVSVPGDSSFTPVFSDGNELPETKERLSLYGKTLIVSYQMLPDVKKHLTIEWELKSEHLTNANSYLLFLDSSRSLLGNKLTVNVSGINASDNRFYGFGLTKPGRLMYNSSLVGSKTLKIDLQNQ